jgi:spore coat polysaccharide biosynthesis protein SpsF (cytidylyltransferase family)|tara:strand:+ start:795 stop:1439 length:645 start_codon:yes stop_codon:yes gene_type:complete
LLCIIQARSSSRRFKSKVLYLIYGIPLIQHVINRIRQSKKISNLIVSSSLERSDDNLIHYLKNKKIKFFRGNLENVAMRLHDTAKKNKAKYFVRISGDSPMIDPKLIDKAIKISQKQKGYDIITNTFPRTFPKGQSVEVIKTSILKKYSEKFSELDREHVTKYFYDNSRNFRIKNFTFNGKNKIMKLSIDTKKDLKNILKNFNKKKFRDYSIKL